MQIGLVMSEYPDQNTHGGMATYTYTMANAFAGLGHEVHLAQKEGVCHDPIDRRVHLHTIQPTRLGGVRGIVYRCVRPEIAYQMGYSLSAKNLFESLAVSDRLEVVQIPEYNGEAITFKSALPFKLVVRLHTPAYLVDKLNGVVPSPSRKAWYRMEYKSIMRADGITASSLALKKAVCSYYKINPDKITVIRNPVDCKNFFPKENNDNSGQIKVLFVGRLEKRKGIELVLEIIKPLLAQHGNLQFIFVGADTKPGKQGYVHQLLIAAERHKDRMRCLGPVPRFKLPDIIRNADIFLIPSLFDNSPNTLFEAMACGLATVGSNVGGINEIIEHEKEGLLFDVQDPNDMLKKLEDLIENRTKRNQMGELARKKVVEQYSPEKRAAETVAYYQQIIH
jgi:glycosyltransferase involved in cell wall biosynthesis